MPFRNAFFVALVTFSSPWISAAQRIVYPQVAVGPIGDQEFRIELRLGNRAAETAWTGSLHFLAQEDLRPMVDLDVIRPNGVTERLDGFWEVDIEAGGSVLHRVSSETLQIGVLIVESGQSDPQNLVPSFIYQLVDSNSEIITDLIAVQPSRESSVEYSAMTSQSMGFNVGIAIVSEKGIEAAMASAARLPVTDIGFQVTLHDGRVYAGVETLGGGEAGQKALFPNQVIEDLPPSFDSARTIFSTTERLTPMSHKLAAATARSSALTAFRSVGLLGILHEYDCGGLGRRPRQSGAFTVSLTQPMRKGVKGRLKSKRLEFLSVEREPS